MIAERCCPLCWSLAWVLFKTLNYYNTQTYIHNAKHAINTHFTYTQLYKVQIQALVHVLVVLNF